MDTLGAKLKQGLHPTKSGCTSTAALEVVEDDLVWAELRDELTKADVITHVGVKEITKRFMAERAKKVEAMQTEKKHPSSEGTERFRRKRSLLWKTLSMKDEEQANSCGLSGSSRRSSAVSVCSRRSSAISMPGRVGSEVSPSSGRRSSSSGPTGMVVDKLCQILQGAMSIDDDDDHKNMSSSGFFARVTSGLNLADLKEDASFEGETRTPSREEEEDPSREEDWNMSCNLQFEEFFEHQRTCLKKQHNSAPEFTRKFLDFSEEKEESNCDTANRCELLEEFPERRPKRTGRVAMTA